MVPVTNLPSHLPDLCLENIFKRVPLRDLLRYVCLVCTNWRRMVPTDLKCRRELVLIRDCNYDVEMVREDENLFGSDLIEHVRREDGSPWVRLQSLDIRFNALLVPGDMLTEGFTSALMDTVPNITHLTVVQWNISKDSIILILQQLIRMLNHYGDRLISFKTNIGYRYNVNDVNLTELVAALFNTVNQLQSLRHLTFNVHLYIDFTALPRLSILSRLDTFTSKNEAPWLMDSILQHATGHVRINWDLHLSVQEMLVLNPQMATKFTEVYISNHLTVAHYDDIRLIGARFLSITRLTLFIDTMPMTMLARFLSPLAQLVHLKIRYDQYIPEDEQPEPEYVQLSSVRLLSLRIATRSHLDTSRLHPSQIFPNLQVLSLYQDIQSCDLCEYDLTQKDDPNLGPEVICARVEHCTPLSRQPFRLCAHLHTIEYNGWPTYIVYSRNLFPRHLITRDQF